MNRRTFLRNTIGGILSIIGISGGGYYYAREIEPAMLHINKQSIYHPSIPATFNNLKIVQFSDTHVGYHYTLNQLEKLVKKINSLNPDIVVFTGDLIDEPQSYKFNKQLSTILQYIKAPQGKFWVYGNHDHGGFGTDIIHETMASADFQLLINEHTIIKKDNEQFIIAGIDDAILGMPDLAKTLKNANSELFTVLLAHEPDYADITVDFPVDIQLSGHSHGGQVRLPFIGHLYTPIYAVKYVEGKYSLNNEALTLYVNKGIGTTRLPFRFLCKPEIHEFTLMSK